MAFSRIRVTICHLEQADETGIHRLQPMGVSSPEMAINLLNDDRMATTRASGLWSKSQADSTVWGS
jgi:hypothetical protein